MGYELLTFGIRRNNSTYLGIIRATRKRTIALHRKIYKD